MLTQILDILECTYFPMLIICINVWFGYQHTCCIDLICSIWHWRELMGSSIFLKLSVSNKWHHWNNLHSYTCSCIQFLAKKPDQKYNLNIFYIKRTLEWKCRTCNWNVNIKVLYIYNWMQFLLQKIKKSTNKHKNRFVKT